MGPFISAFPILYDSRQAVHYGEFEPILDSVWTEDVVHLDRHSRAGFNGNILERQPARAKQGALAVLPVRSNRVELYEDRLVVVYAGMRSSIPLRPREGRPAHQEPLGDGQLARPRLHRSAL